MTRIRCLEPASTNCSVALSEDGSVAAFKEDNGRNYSHSESLHVFIEEMLQQAGVSLAQLDGVAVSKGPGSYTGLRIGVSAAKGLCFSLDIPLIAIPTLDNLAMQIETEGLIVPMLDARRMEVYAEIFNAQFETLFPQQPVLLEEFDFDVWLDQKRCFFFGDGSDKARQIITHPNARFINGIVPSANDIGVLAWQKFEREENVDVAYFEPEYLKEFQATKPKKIF